MNLIDQRSASFVRGDALFLYPRTGERRRAVPQHTVFEPVTLDTKLGVEIVRKAARLAPGRLTRRQERYIEWYWTHA